MGGSRVKLTGAWQHTDERSPHFHFALIPQLEDGSLGWAKVQLGMADGVKARTDTVTRKEFSASMSRLQDAYYEEVAKHFGLGRGKKGSKRKYRKPDHNAPFPDRVQAQAAEAGKGSGEGSSSVPELPAAGDAFLDSIKPLSGGGGGGGGGGAYAFGEAG